MDLLDKRFNDLFIEIKKYITHKNDLDIIEQSYLFAKNKHEGTYRIGGGPYINHILDTVEVLIGLHAGPSTLISGFLHDTVEDVEDVTSDLIEEIFGKDVSLLVDSVTKVNMAEDEKEKSKDLTIKKIFKAMGDDVRTIVIKIADRISNMRTLDCVSEEQKNRVSKQTLEIYAPVARCIGLNEIAKEMEDLCLYYLYKEDYMKIKDYVETNNKENFETIQNMRKKIKNALLELNIKSLNYFKNKDFYNIFKFLNSNHNIEEIEDMNVINIILDSTVECYMALGVIHSIYTPIFGKMKDYIASPKYNMYQAIHTLIINPRGGTIKISIKTKMMDDIYNFGVASKWAYVEGKGYDKEAEQEEIRKHLNIIRELDRINSEDGVTINEYVKLLKEDVFNNNQYIYVYTPDGESVVLPVESTVLDFAFKIHTQIGEGLSDAYINGIKADIYSPLKNGSIITLRYDSEIKVKEEWLEHVKTNYAKLKIRKRLIKMVEENEK